MAISTTDARALFTKKLVAVYKEKPLVRSFLRSFFRVEESMTKTISIEVQRGSEKVAVDVVRGTEGNRNTMTRSSEKIFLPPFYWEYLNANEHQLYDVAIGSKDQAVFTQLIKQLADDVDLLRQKIDRAYELQCGQVVETGIVQLKGGINIEFKRKAESLVDSGSGNYWANADIDPFAQIEEGITFMRQVGKAQGEVFNVILGSTALNDLYKNNVFKDRQNAINLVRLDSVAAPQRNSVGASLHGELSVGSYRARLWTYPEYYDNAAGVSTPYINAKKIIVLPENPNFVMAFAAVPQLITEDGGVPQQGAFLMTEHLDTRKAVHEIGLKSAGVAVPVAVDQIYTRKVVA